MGEKGKKRRLGEVDRATIVCNLKIGTQSQDSEIAQIRMSVQTIIYNKRSRLPSTMSSVGEEGEEK